MSNTPENKPIGPFTLTPARIILLAFGILALVSIFGGIMGGVSNVNDLRNARDAALSSSEAPPSEASAP
ncbi:MAG: hypothetical protein EOP22_07270 [Hyphomicrobiales bacterium]|nr:MAG: hypothetical protein EOP22_07270 [Hyphomicrobiales bacterium]